MLESATTFQVLQRLVASSLPCANDLVFLATVMLPPDELSSPAASKEAVTGLVDEPVYCEILYLVCDLTFALQTGVAPLQPPR